ncbi:hypothetical protein [Gudongella sp. DL1XJH-153]|uniref:hypothetical protein n=1 Tax=Gudongella sp. DL1XJH-153 TaxID=3409804 RepID=UPI003BB4A146
MVSLIERFETHEMHETTGIVQQKIEQLREIEFDAGSMDYIDRMDAVVSYTTRVFDNVDPYLVPIAHMNNINKYFKEVNQIASSLIEDKIVSRFNNLNLSIENALIHVNYINSLSTSEDLTGLREDITSIRRSISAFRGSIEREHKKSIDELMKEKEELHDSLTDLNTKIESEKLRIDNFIDNGQKTINSFQNKYLEASETRSKDFISSIDEYSGKFEEFMRKTNEEKDYYMNSLDEHREEVENIVGALSINGLASGFKKEADTERWNRWIWHVATLGFIIALIYFSIDFVNSFRSMDSVSAEISWALVFARLIVVSALGTAFGYCAKQASTHSKNERYNRLMQLELASINSYLANMPEATQYEIKELLTERLFGKAEVVLKESFVNDSKDEKGLFITQDWLRDMVKLINKN